MHVAVNGTRLWFDVLGPGLAPEGAGMLERPTLILLHGGPGGFDHSYFRPSFDPLAAAAQVICIDLRAHGRSDRGDPSSFSFEACADDLADFCDALSIDSPILIGHSMGGFVAQLFGARHPGRAAGLVLLATAARHDLERLVEGFRRQAGDEVAAIARRSYAGGPVADDEWARVRLAFGPHVLSPEERARIVRNDELRDVGMERLRTFDVTGQLHRIDVPTLVLVGSLDPVTPVSASEEILAGLAPGIGKMEVLEGAGHWLWLDAPDHVRSLVRDFATGVAVTGRTGVLASGDRV